MANDPAFLFYPGDYLRDTQCLSEKVQVSYDRIMCEHMRNICISQQQLKFFTKRLSEDEKEELMYTLTKVNGGYQIEWVALSIMKRRAYSESRRKNKAGKKKNICKSYDNHMENEIENRDKDKNLKEEDKKSLDYLKNNLEDFKNDEFKNVNVNLEYRKFCDYLKSKGKRYKDYTAAFRNWLRSEYVPKTKPFKPGKYDHLVEIAE